MSKLLKFREKLNLTQEELAEKSGISVRTIQRIEAGTNPKGHTLKALAKTLDVEKSKLLKNTTANSKFSYRLIKLINLSSLPFIIFPPANILIPLTIMLAKKQFNYITKRIITIQILWTIFSVILFLFSSVVEKWFFSGNKLNLVVIMLSILVNIYIIIRNSAEIDKNKKLYISLKFSII
ncbi:helix-turn-helix domain-containing protein [Pontimicrobium sp. SW4]|uniref:Helix-turn-helix domain-containing protein n=1 Tax=Pontimicrobium sp. SW4 TaxID=3153519 RepID=A0AAU7BQN1_9FLAO